MHAKQFVIIIGLCAFVIAFALGSIVTLTTGIPLAGGLLNGILVAMVLTIGMLASPFRWSGTLMWIVFSIPAIPTTTLGPPGLYKIVIAIVAGLIWDVCYQFIFSRKKRIGLYIGAIAGGIAITLLMILILRLIASGIGEALSFSEDVNTSLQSLKDYFWYLLPINFIVTAIGVRLGEFMYYARLKSVLKIYE
ncbi:MAG: hypothetical protein KKI12_10970 [Proteobacteria bacterium]|nr:hypothetical protein [Pseudomonadota bacterium]